MSSPVIKGTTAVWGAGSVYSGIVLSATREADGDKDVVYDDDGFEQGVIYFADKEKGTVELLCESDTEIPVRGDAITFESESTFLCEKTTIRWEQRGWKKLSIEAVFYPNVTTEEPDPGP